MTILSKEAIREEILEKLEELDEKELKNILKNINVFLLIPFEHKDFFKTKYPIRWNQEKKLWMLSLLHYSDEVKKDCNEYGIRCNIDLDGK